MSNIVDMAYSPYRDYIKEEINYNLSFPFIEILKRVNVRGEDNGLVFTDNTRRNAIIELAKHSNLKRIHYDGFYLMYATMIDESKPIKLITCHIDHIYGRKTFCRQEGNSIIGTLDNSASIAVLLRTMMCEEVPPNTIISFTGDEEKDSRGVEGTIKLLRNYDIELGVVMDVSADNYESDVSIENFYHTDNVQRFKNNIYGICEKYGIDGGEDPKLWVDEAEIFKKHKIPCLTLCVPVHPLCSKEDLEYMDIIREHCPKGLETTMDKIKSTQIALTSILKEDYYER